MIVVSGCPRSGTSLMMRLLALALGEERVLGEAFPRERQLAEAAQRGPDESESHYAFRRYTAAILDPHAVEEAAKSRDLNPNGFWECPFTVRGVRFRADLEKKLNALEEEKERPTICKIVSQGLAQSDPRYIHKIVYMVRHPRAVAKSQERLRREMRFRTEDGAEHDLYEGAIIHSPKMFIEVTMAALRWIESHPSVPIMFVKYDDLIGDASTTLARVRAFLGEGDEAAWAQAATVINPSLRRSYPEEHKSNLWVDAEDAYSILEAKDFAAARQFEAEEWRPVHREDRRWVCLRCEQPMVENHCRACRVNHNGFRDSLRDFAEHNRIPWRERPCAFEVAYDLDGPLVLLEESIARNFWVEGPAIVNLNSPEVSHVGIG